MSVLFQERQKQGSRAVMVLQGRLTAKRGGISHDRMTCSIELSAIVSGGAGRSAAVRRIK